jgi:NAD(P)-dependent dehydrogenase (short-subunit alcohol dehydrogenase family)
MKKFEAKVALITGGTSGIGEATARAFAEEAARVVIAGRREKEGTAVVADIRRRGGHATFVATDVTRDADVRKLVQAALRSYGRLDVAFNNAGTEGVVGPIAELEEAAWTRTIDVNLKGTWLSMKHEIPAMAERGGAIVNIATIAAIAGVPGTTIYAASKGGVVAMTRAAAIEWAAKGIRVNVVSPGAVETDMLERFTGGDERAKAEFKAAHPLGRAASVADIANAVLWLASDAAAFVTGHNLVVDGGYTAR